MHDKSVCWRCEHMYGITREECDQLLQLGEPAMTEETATTNRKGPKPNPFVRLEKARAKAEKARAAYAKVQNIADALAEAEAEEQQALQELAEATAAAGIAVGFEER